MTKDENNYWQERRAFVAVNKRGIPLAHTISIYAIDCRNRAAYSIGCDWKTCVKLHGLKVKKCSLQIDIWKP